VADISHIVYIGIVYKILLTIPFECIVYVIDDKRCCRYNQLGKPVVRLAMLNGSHSIIEGITLIILGLFIYFWTLRNSVSDSMQYFRSVQGVVPNMR